MKNVTIKLVTTLFMSLMLILPVFINAQVDTQERNVGPFSGIHQTISADVFVTKGNVQSVKVKADADKIDLITTDVEDGILTISTRQNLRNTRTIEVYITIPTLDHLKNSGSGDIVIEGGLSGNDIDIQISGSGDLDADLDATNCKLMISGSGDVDLAGVKGNFSIKIMDSGDVEAEDLILDNCEVESMGSGDIKLKGKAAKLSAKLSGSGDFNGYGITSVTAYFKCNGSGDVVVNAVEKLSAVLNGSGDLTYYGSPEYVDVESNGSGEVYRK